MIIRPASYADSAMLAQIQVDSYRNAYAGILPQTYLENFDYDEQTQDWQDLLLSERAFILLVAEDENGWILGYTLGHAGSDGFEGYDSVLDALHVQRSEQRQGVGRSLIGGMATRLAAGGASSIMCWVLLQNPARALYERLGGKPLGHRSITLGEDTVAEEIAYGWSDISDLARL
ncbi:MAG: family N-acetyltransferase [Chloroflexi bacterium]|nr:family N-acetyltransferase [Chloroflexota bacterium]